MDFNEKKTSLSMETFMENISKCRFNRFIRAENPRTWRLFQTRLLAGGYCTNKGVGLHSEFQGSNDWDHSWDHWGCHTRKEKMVKEHCKQCWSLQLWFRPSGSDLALPVMSVGHCGTTGAPDGSS